MHRTYVYLGKAWPWHRILSFISLYFPTFLAISRECARTDVRKHVLSEVATNYRSSPTPTSSVALLVASLLAARRENTNTTTKYNDKYKIQHTLGQLQSEAPDCEQLYFSRSLKSLSSTSPPPASGGRLHPSSHTIRLHTHTLPLIYFQYFALH